MKEFFAYGDDNVPLEIVMRLQAVKRWHMIDTTRAQTLAEHSANVALLAYTIAYKVGFPAFVQPYTILALALFHDLGETIIGDIPTHTKRALGANRIPLDALESSVLPSMFGAVDQCPPGWTALIKCCDLADGIRFIRLHGIDVTAVHAKQGLEDQLQARLEEAREHWPAEGHAQVSKMIHFYAYEHS